MLRTFVRMLPISAIFIFTINGYTAFEYKGYGSTYLACGSAGLAARHNSFSIFINPSKLARTDQTMMELYYRNFYGIRDLNQITLSGQFSIMDIPVGFGISRYGNKIYSETEIRIGAGYKIGEDILLGFSANTYYLEIQNYGSAVTLGFDLSLLYTISDKLAAACLVSNINEPKLGTTHERIPAYFAFGFSYAVIGDADLNFDIVKDTGFDFDYRIGINYHFNKWLVLYSGFQDQVNSLSAGFGIMKNQINLGYAFIYHPQLGGSNSISVGYAF